MNAMNTHYPDAPRAEPVNRHTLAVVVDNEPGVLARIAGLFSGRGYNIESLTVSETEHQKHISRITIVTTGTNAVIEQIKSQLERLVPVHRVVDLTVQGEAIERELCLLKVVGRGDHRVEALRLASAFGARTVDATLTSFVFELTGVTEEIERFIGLMTAVGLTEVSRTGIAAISRGAEGNVILPLDAGASADGAVANP
jgi:acetolactate synthase-1/3 small subunit